MRIRIEGTELPGRDGAGGGNPPGYGNVYVGIQRRNRPADVIDLFAGDADAAVWTFDATVIPGPTGRDIRGSFIQGGPGQRFIYLSWGTVADGTFAMFRRAKLFLEDVPDDILAAAERSGRLVARLGLTDAKGHPLCARVRPPAIRWSAE